MIIRENSFKIDHIECKDILIKDGSTVKPENMIFFDLEHYVYKKPKCVGVFGACIYNKNKKQLEVTQYMIENKSEVVDILYLGKNYFQNKKSEGKNIIVTFSGNNDFTVINYLFDKYGINCNLKEEFESIDLQKEYEKECMTSIGLKKLEKCFGIIRESEVISGANLAKTFHKVIKDKDYLNRMPKDKLEKILLYNEQDVVNLYYILTSWLKHIDELKEIEKKKLEKRQLNDDKYDEENVINEIKNIEDIEAIKEKENLEYSEKHDSKVKQE